MLKFKTSIPSPHEFSGKFWSVISLEKSWKSWFGFEHVVFFYQISNERLPKNILLTFHYQVLLTLIKSMEHVTSSHRTLIRWRMSTIFDCVYYSLFLSLGYCTFFLIISIGKFRQPNDWVFRLLLLECNFKNGMHFGNMLTRDDKNFARPTKYHDQKHIDFGMLFSDW